VSETPAPAKKRGRPKAKKEEVSVPLINVPGTKKEQLHFLYDSWHNCQRCILGSFREPGVGDIVFGEGNADTADIVIVGEGPGEEEERTSVPFVGNSGHLLNQILASTADDPQIQKFHEEYNKLPRTGKQAQLNAEHFHKQIFEWRYNRFFITNAVACRPPENRQPTQDEIKACWERLWNIIYVIDPLMIIALGNSALAAVMQKAQVKITAMRGHIYDVEYKGRFGKVIYPVVPTFHPSYLLRKADWKVKGGDWEKTLDDVRKALRVADFLRNKYYGTPIPQR
jgi:uracil-DNA glycosylase